MSREELHPDEEAHTLAIEVFANAALVHAKQQRGRLVENGIQAAEKIFLEMIACKYLPSVKTLNMLMKLKSVVSFEESFKILLYFEKFELSPTESTIRQLLRAIDIDFKMNFDFSLPASEQISEYSRKYVKYADAVVTVMQTHKIPMRKDIEFLFKVISPQTLEVHSSNLIQ